MTPFRRTVLLSGMAFAFALLLALVWLPINAQDASSAFATNTAPAAPPSFATNTPQPTAQVIAIPNASFDRYALRRWDEASLTATLLDQVNQLKADEIDRQNAIRLLQHELEHRFPGGPHNAEMRDQLLQAMLRAPRASVDMRSVVWATIETMLNQSQPDFNTEQAFQYEDFGIHVLPAKIDGDNRTDAVLGIDYPAGEAADLADDRSLLFSGYVLARIDDNGAYHILPGDYPSAPLGAVDRVQQLQVGDTNGDRLSELVVSAHHTDDVNSEMFIFGWRNGGAANLIEPGEHLRYGRIVGNVPENDHSINVMEYRVESAAWNCLGERPLSWSWSFNFFRPPEQLENFSFQNRLGCLLYGAEPLFEMPVADALTTIDRMIPLATQEDQYAAERAGLVQAMLHVLNSEPAIALEQIKGLQTVDPPANSWLGKEISAFLNAAGTSLTPVQFCAALQNAADYGACDVNQVLARLFKEQPFNRDEPIEAQAARLGLTVLDSLTLTQVGRLDRQAVHFDLSADAWWSFAPLVDNIYTAEQIDTPPGYEPSRAPTLLLVPPANAYNALLVNDDPTEALNVLDNLVRMNPEARVDSSVRLMQALAYDQLGDRTNARQTYFDVWIGDPASVWGQLAAAHLEKR